LTIADGRDHQRFPVLDRNQLETARRFASGPEARFSPGEMIYEIGAVDVPAWLVLDGTIEVFRRDGLSGQAPIVTHNAGQSAAM